MHAGSTDTIIGRCGICEGGADGGMRRRGHGVWARVEQEVYTVDMFIPHMFIVHISQIA